MGIVRLNVSTSGARPRGGRPLVMVKATPAARRRVIASRVRGVMSLFLVTRVPSTSAISSLMVMQNSWRACRSQRRGDRGGADETDLWMGHDEGGKALDQRVQAALALEGFAEAPLL